MFRVMAREDFLRRTLTFLALGCFGTAWIVACDPPSIEGTPYDNSDAIPAKRTPPTSASGEPQGQTSSAETQGAQVTETDAGGVVPATDAAAPAASSATPPNCANPNVLTCFTCCLDANPDATPVENAYDNCIDSCTDQACNDACHAQHLTNCNASTSCLSHHACLQANGCFTNES
jgi:hypothetical protein